MRFIQRIALPAAGWARVYGRVTSATTGLVDLLSADEQIIWNRWRTARRSRDWLEGRLCIKHSLIQEQTCHTGIRPDLITVLPIGSDRLRGAPIVTVEGGPLRGRFSISDWTHGVAVAMSVGPVGVDGERVWHDSRWRGLIQRI